MGEEIQLPDLPDLPDRYRWGATLNDDGLWLDLLEHQHLDTWDVIASRMVSERAAGFTVSLADKVEIEAGHLAHQLRMAVAINKKYRDGE